MMIKMLLLAGGLSLASVSLGGCAYQSDDEERRAEQDKGAVAGTSAGDGSSRSYAVSGFTAIAAVGSDDIIVTRGDRFAVTAAGDAELLDRLVIRVEGDTLQIRRRSGSWPDNGRGATVRVTMPRLTGIESAGSGSITADTLTGDDASIDIAGSGDIRLTGVAARKLAIAIAGSGKVEASGSAETIEADLAGSGDIASPTLTARTAEINIAGSGNVAMAVTGTADIGLFGSGDVTLTGGATCTTIKMGNGEVNCS